MKIPSEVGSPLMNIGKVRCAGDFRFELGVCPFTALETHWMEKAVVRKKAARPARRVIDLSLGLTSLSIER
jgi:hypothetical protein